MSIHIDSLVHTILHSKIYLENLCLRVLMVKNYPGNDLLLYNNKYKPIICRPVLLLTEFPEFNCPLEFFLSG